MPLLKSLEYFCKSDNEEENYKLSEKKGSTAQEVGDAFLLRKRRSDTSRTLLTKKARASVIFTLEDKEGIRNQYLGLLDTGSTGGLISKELVEKYGFSITKHASTWGTNAGNFKTDGKATVAGLRFP